MFGTRKFLGQRTGTSRAGAGRDVVPGWIPTPGQGPGGTGQPQGAATVAHWTLPTPAPPIRVLHLSFALKELQT